MKGWDTERDPVESRGPLGELERVGVREVRREKSLWGTPTLVKDDPGVGVSGVNHSCTSDGGGGRNLSSKTLDQRYPHISFQSGGRTPNPCRRTCWDRTKDVTPSLPSNDPHLSLLPDPNVVRLLGRSLCLGVLGYSRVVLLLSFPHRSLPLLMTLPPGFLPK